MKAYGVNCVANNVVCRKFNIEGYPSVFIIPAKHPLEKWKEIMPDKFNLQSVEQLLFSSESAVEAAPPEARIEVADAERKLGPTTELQAEAEMLIAPDEEETSVEEGYSFGSKKGSIPMAGAEIAGKMDKEMDRWKEIQRKKMKRQHRLGMAKPPMEVAGMNATSTMKSHRVTKSEFVDRLLEIQKKVRKYNGKRNTEVGEALQNGRLPFKKNPTKPKFIEKLPIIKHLPMVQMSGEEELILDASLSFLVGMSVNVFKSNKPLTPEKRKALFEFLNVMSVGLPPEWGKLQLPMSPTCVAHRPEKGLHDTIDELLASFDGVVKNIENMRQVLNRHPFPRSEWSPTCRKSSNPFTCGFWKLLHTMTVGIAEHRGGSDLPDAERRNRIIFSPLRAADAIKGYMEHFVFCSECSEHFLTRYNDCSVLRRCARLTTSIDYASDADWKELAKWLWEFHNVVSVDILRNSKKSDTSLSDEVQVLWPSLDACFFCYKQDGSYDEDVVFLKLEETYWYVEQQRSVTVANGSIKARTRSQVNTQITFNFR